MKPFLFLSHFILCAILSLMSCNKDESNYEAPPIMTTQSSNKTFTWLALGDSYTIGEGVLETERFPYLTSLLLKDKNIVVKEIRYIAKTGWSTLALQSAIKNAEPLGTYDIVTLLIGVNDQYQHLDTGAYRTRFTQLLNKSVELTGNSLNRVFVLSIPDYSATPFVSASNKQRVSEEISWFNAINKEITLKKGIAYIDITDLSKAAANDATLLANDRLHYSAKAHKQWADMLLPSMLAALK